MTKGEIELGLFGKSEFELVYKGTKITVTEHSEMYVDDKLVAHAKGILANIGIPFLSTTTLLHQYQDSNGLNELKAVLYYKASHQKVTLYINEEQIGSGHVSAG